MSIDDKKELNLYNKKISEVHYLPCHIEYDGTAQISSYFNIKQINSNNNSQYSSSIRGRELKGVSIILPNNVSGYTFTKDRIEDESVIKLSNNFNKITYWQHDIMPDKNSLSDQLNWFEIAAAINSDD